ncbi:hypothetical protein MYX84_11925 [Acidobacteria bacterium AH-259-O06]|nr:hypothetical protein [Acidobacteria bacterium AH-259-O06]
MILAESLIFGLTQATLYLIIFAIGFVFLLVTFVLGELFEGVGELAEHLDIDFDHDFDHGDHGLGPSILSPKILSVFVTVFGGTGYIVTVQFDYSLLGTSLIGIVSGVILASITFGVVSWLYTQQSTTMVSPESLVGKKGTVSIGIPRAGIGQVVLNVVGARVTKSARSEDGEAIEPNSRVTVVSVEGSGVIVRPS